MPLIQSMSGTRGLVPDDLTPEIVIELARAFALTQKTGPLIVGGDTRTTVDVFKHAVISGLLYSGIDVIDIGKIPTPTLQQAIIKHHARGGICITASHNPIQWNGLKFMNEKGSFLNEEEYNVFMKNYDKKHSFTYQSWDNIGTLTTYNHAISDHIDKIKTHINIEKIKHSKLKVLIDTNNGAGSIASPLLLDQLGVDYKILNPKPNGIFAHNPEPTKANLEELIHEMKSGDFDIGFAQDADADRLVIIDEHGHFIGEDNSLALCMEKILIDNDSSSSPDIVVNLSTSQVIEHVAEKYNGTVHYTKIGEVHVSQKIRSANALVGGEGNGGIIYPKIGWGRDSLTGITIALSYLAESKKTVSDIVKKYPKYTMLKNKIDIQTHSNPNNIINDISNQFPDTEKITIDGTKIILKDSWVHIRPSNTEPIIRIFIEAKTAKEAETLFKKCHV